ncbi:MAG: hypothetical protein Q4Q20_00145 [Methanocorpusculum sp.]|nr:hypothetical protein [Methanocorpusculum sp.]
MAVLNALELTKYDFREYGLIYVDYEVDGAAVTDTFTYDSATGDVIYKSSGSAFETLSSAQALTKIRNLEQQYHADISVNAFF